MSEKAKSLFNASSLSQQTSCELRLQSELHLFPQMTLKFAILICDMSSQILADKISSVMFYSDKLSRRPWCPNKQKSFKGHTHKHKIFPSKAQQRALTKRKQNGLCSSTPPAKLQNTSFIPFNWVNVSETFSTKQGQNRTNVLRFIRPQSELDTTGTYLMIIMSDRKSGQVLPSAWRCNISFDVLKAKEIILIMIMIQVCIVRTFCTYICIWMS